MEALARNNPRVKLRVVDVVGWESAVAQQYNIRSLPTVWLYEDGELYSKDLKTIVERLGRLK